MQLVEQHIISKKDCRLLALDKAAFASKNLYNAANYLIRQEFIFIKRGLFSSKSGILINADVNGAYDIIRKVAPNAFADGVEGAVVRPLKVSFKN